MKRFEVGQYPLDQTALHYNSSSFPLPFFDYGWQHIFGEARTRILLWYVLILGLVFLAGIPVLQYLLFYQLDERVRRQLEQEVATFRELIAYNHDSLEPDRAANLEDLELLREQLQEHHVQNIPLKSQEDLSEFFDHYLRYRIPADDTFLLTFVNGQFYKSSPRARPQALNPNAALMQEWQKQTQPIQGEVEVADPTVNKFLFMLEPVYISRHAQGAFVVAYATAGEQAEILAVLTSIGKVSLALFVISLILAWLAAGRVLAPLRTITTTAQTISETDLSQRLPVEGRGELAELAATFNTMMDRLETSFGSQREFVNDAGHELRTPITIIRGHLELMGTDPDEQRETLALVDSELERMSRLVDDLILLAKAERTDFLRLITVDAAELTEELFTKAQALAERDWQLDATARGQIVVDRERITEAVMNLAQNATQHTLGEDMIAIGSTISRGKVHFWVRDTGEGIPLPDQKRIFERFARAANSRRRSEGAGLGLSIVKAIAEAHGGQVLLRSKLGSGSMFTIVLPLDPLQETTGHVAYPHRRR